METVGRKILGIKYHWMRYEFTPGRGQIHCHLLAIVEDNSIYKLCFDDLKETDGEERRASRLAKWAKDKFNLTATVPKDFDEREALCHPSFI